MIKRVLALAAVTAALVIPSAAPAAAVAPTPAAQTNRSADAFFPEYWSAYSNHQSEGHCVWAGENWRSYEYWRQYYCANESEPGSPFELWTLYINELYTQG